MKWKSKRYGKVATYGITVTRRHEERLNDLAANMPLDNYLDNYDYLTNKNRETHCTRQDLLRYYLDGSFGSQFRRLDPIAFYASINDGSESEEE